MNKLKLGFEVIKNMGWSYIQFRTLYELMRKSGLLKKKFPPDVQTKKLVSKDEWTKSYPAFFFNGKNSLRFPKHKYPLVDKIFSEYQNGNIQYFGHLLFPTVKEYNWITNPQSGYKYNINQHWTKIEDFSAESGDIKFVWEKSRFSYLYDLIRYDYHFEQDISGRIFNDILSWIEANPLNMGPNYKCSQEISIRLLNWTFALNYYKYSENLSEDVFQKIIGSIYQQVKHVYSNINFSRKSVRNNHALTETLALYLIGLLYPFFPESERWKSKGKKWFEKEIAYQIYDDGAYLQFSMNYQRVVVQLLTWAFYLAKYNNEKFSEYTYSKAKKTLDFLLNMQDSVSGRLPNYGANDGALFFKLNDSYFRDFRPQLNALYYFFNKHHIYSNSESKEDTFWYNRQVSEDCKPINQPVLNSHSAGGYYTIRDADSLTFIRCGSHKDRPSHADNLHVDIWHMGKNIFHDSGTFQYNTDKRLHDFFTGTSAHNTVQLDNNDQMLKGPRFIWINWSQAVYGGLRETEEYYFFEGKIHAFKHIAKDIFHKRIVKKYKNKSLWIIEDQLLHDTSLPIIQLWNTKEEFQNIIKVESFDQSGNSIAPQIENGWYSSFYGKKEPSLTYSFTSIGSFIKTVIELKQNK